MSLVIGIISAIRDILTVGAELSLTGGSGPPLGRSMTELAVNAWGVLALAVALVLIRRFARLDRATTGQAYKQRRRRAGRCGPACGRRPAATATRTVPLTGYGLS